jgi:hypothetical protein
MLTNRKRILANRCSSTTKKHGMIEHSMWTQFGKDTTEYNRVRIALRDDADVWELEYLDVLGKWVQIDIKVGITEAAALKVLDVAHTLMAL